MRKQSFIDPVRIAQKVDYDIEAANDYIDFLSRTSGDMEEIHDWCESTVPTVGLPCMQKTYTWKPDDKMLRSLLKMQDTDTLTIVFWFYVPIAESASEHSVIEGSIVMADFYIESVSTKNLWTEYLDVSTSDFQSMTTTMIENLKAVLEVGD